MNLKKGNIVKILTGKDKNKTGEIIEILSKFNKAKVTGINMVKKHFKATKENTGGIISKENFIHVSNLTLNENKKQDKKKVNYDSKIKRTIFFKNTNWFDK